MKKNIVLRLVLGVVFFCIMLVPVSADEALARWQCDGGMCTIVLRLMSVHTYDTINHGLRLETGYDAQVTGPGCGDERHVLLDFGSISGFPPDSEVVAVVITGKVTSHKTYWQDIGDYPVFVNLVDPTGNTVYGQSGIGPRNSAVYFGLWGTQAEQFLLDNARQGGSFRVQLAIESQAHRWLNLAITDKSWPGMSREAPTMRILVR